MGFFNLQFKNKSVFVSDHPVRFDWALPTNITSIQFSDHFCFIGCADGQLSLLHIKHGGLIQAIEKQTGSKDDGPITHINFIEAREENVDGFTGTVIVGRGSVK
jgi:hypothetical protein